MLSDTRFFVTTALIKLSRKVNFVIYSILRYFLKATNNYQIESDLILQILKLFLRLQPSIRATHLVGFPTM